jgi:methyl-accepting chemotaxis protein
MPLDSAGPPNSVATTQHDDRALRLRFLRLDAPARARLRGLKPLIEAALPRVSEAFYQLFGQVPALAAMFGGAARVARLRITLADHWSRLFNGDFDDAYVEHAVSIGAAHARIGLEPRWYIAGYCLSLESIIEVVVKRHRAKPALAADIAVLLRAAFLDMDLALSSYQRSDEVERVSDEMNGLADVLDRELQLAVGEISLQTERLVEAGRGLSDIAADMRGMTEQVRDGIGTTSTTIGTVASASQELEASSREITAQVDRAAEVSLQTVEAADETGRTSRAPWIKSTESSGWCSRSRRGPNCWR